MYISITKKNYINRIKSRANFHYSIYCCPFTQIVIRCCLSLSLIILFVFQRIASQNTHTKKEFQKKTFSLL